MSTWTSRITLTFLAFAASVKPGLAAHARNSVSASQAEAVGSKRSRLLADVRRPLTSRETMELDGATASRMLGEEGKMLSEPIASFLSPH